MSENTGNINKSPERNMMAQSSQTSYALSTVEIQRQEELKQAGNMFDEIVSKTYLNRLSSAQVIPYTGPELPIRWYHITKIVYEEGVFFTDKMAMLYSALHNVCDIVAMALKKRDGKTELYIGTRDVQGNDFVSGKILNAGMKGILPGIAFENTGCEQMIDSHDERSQSISCVSGVASLTDDRKERFIQGIENLINSTKSIDNFTTLILANKVSGTEAAQIRKAYENLYSEISVLNQVQMSYNESESQGITTSLTEGFNKSVTQNVSRTISHGTSESTSVGESQSKSSGWNGGIPLLITMIGHNSSKSVSTSLNKTIGKNQQNSAQKGESTMQGENKSISHGMSENTTVGKTLQLTRHNRYVQSCMDTLDRQIERMQKSAPSGLWSVATYFIADSDTTSQELAGIYRGIIVGDQSEVETLCINQWKCRDRQGNPNPQVGKLKHYLTNQLHPQFQLDNGMVCTAGSMVDSRELAIHLSLPQSSVPGLLVRKEQAFGRDVKTTDGKELTEANSIPLGHVVHLGEEYSETVRLDINGLAKHIFVTGTTGSGKSNTLYLLIDQLCQQGKTFLVIEPAKGEYKNVFGQPNDVTIYGTNPRASKLLTLNPFQFPDEVDVYEHIDSLVEIFNACWPMYAAMPQVLKHSIIEAYKTCGWDLSRSENPLGIYPTVEDVLDALKEYINSSEYSSDTKGDYKGSLETRLQSMCEGIVGRMFRGTPVADEQLFNQNAIIDLSRVKSSETKSLLMGLLVMKLNEFRMAEQKGMNQQLRHVTVLEEAHNLLKRTSTDQSAESSNVAGMAVEKIANSMAEMRTYGEGFIIADQSPSMLDLATIRNTNTKIIMALPEREDRDAAGKAIGLDEHHIPELSRLKTGEAIIYQNGWEEPVKTKIDQYPVTETPWTYKPDEQQKNKEEQHLKAFYLTLYRLYARAFVPYDKDKFEQLVTELPVAGRKKHILLDKIRSATTPSVDDCALMMAALHGTALCQQMQQATDIAEMNTQLYRHLQQSEGLREMSHMDTFVNMYVRGCSLMAKEPFYQEWQTRTLKSRMI